MITRRIRSIVAGGAILASILAGVTTANADPGVIYDTVPPILPTNMPSLGYQATSTTEFGDMISFAAGSRDVQTVTVTMSSWACENSSPCVTTPGTGFAHDITLNLYEVDTTGTTPAPGDLIVSTSDTFQIPFRPSATVACGTGFDALDLPGGCANGLAFNIEFDLGSVIVPDSIIFGISYSTQSYGPVPTGVAGPYNSLNVALNSTGPTVGTDVDGDVAYWDTSHAGFYADGGAAGVGIFRADTAWAPYTVAARFATVEPPALTVEDCKNGGHVAAGFRNQGQCVASFQANENAGK